MVAALIISETLQQRSCEVFAALVLSSLWTIPCRGLDRFEPGISRFRKPVIQVFAASSRLPQCSIPWSLAGVLATGGNLGWGADGHFE